MREKTAPFEAALYSPRKPPVVSTTSGPDWLRLFDIAFEQHGFFTTLQARACRVSNHVLRYHVGRGVFERVSHGRLCVVSMKKIGQSDTAPRRTTRGHTTVAITKATHERLLSMKEKLLSENVVVTVGFLVDAGLDALEVSTCR